MMGQEFFFRDKIPVAILGATGSVGQRFVELLAYHPWFTIVAVAASEKSAGRPYKNAVNWLMSTPIPPHIAEMEVQACFPVFKCPLVFSAMDASVAGEIESIFARAGYTVVTNARNHRMSPHVPLLIPEVNSGHLAVLEGSAEKIIANPNCSTIGFTLALKPLLDAFGIEAVHVVTMQAVSGAGYPGVSSLDILDNLIPYIAGEEHKIETEPLKILGTLQDHIVSDATINISAQCNRVPVVDGHTGSVSIKLTKRAPKEDLIHVWRNFLGEAQEEKLPSAPSNPIHYFDEVNYPQPRLHRNLDKGMAVSIGQLRKCPLLDYKFTFLSHNTIRGAAGGAILCGEMLVKKGLIHW